MDERITITRAQLKKALADWEQRARDGKTIGRKASDRLSIEEHSEQTVEPLWVTLGGKPQEN